MHTTFVAKKIKELGYNTGYIIQDAGCRCSKDTLPQRRRSLDQHRGWLRRQGNAAQLSIQGGNVGGHGLGLGGLGRRWGGYRAGQSVGRGIGHQALQQTAHTAPGEGPVKIQKPGKGK